MAIAVIDPGADKASRLGPEGFGRRKITGNTEIRCSEATDGQQEQKDNGQQGDESRRSKTRPFAPATWWTGRTRRRWRRHMVLVGAVGLLRRRRVWWLCGACAVHQPTARAMSMSRPASGRVAGRRSELSRPGLLGPRWRRLRRQLMVPGPWARPACLVCLLAAVWSSTNLSSHPHS